MQPPSLVERLRATARELRDAKDTHDADLMDEAADEIAGYQEAALDGSLVLADAQRSTVSVEFSG